MKRVSLLFFLFLISLSLVAQTEERGLKLSIQTDLIAYTAPGGWSLWGVIQHHENKMSLAYVNFPDRYASYYEETGMKELDQIFRLQLARYFKPSSKLKDFYVGTNVEFHLRTLEEDNNIEKLEDTGMKFAAIFGYEWHPFEKKENFFSNFSIGAWAGPTFLLNYDEGLEFPGTGSVYEATEPIEVALGLNLSYTFYKNY